MNDNYLTMVVHGPSKVGKTTLASTAGKPLLVLDSDGGGMRFVSGSKTTWDPVQGPPASGFDIYRVDVTQLDHITSAYQFITQTDPAFFKTVVFDSVTELQARLKREIDADGMLDQQGWGRILAKFEDLIWQFRDLASSTRCAVNMVVYIAEQKLGPDGLMGPAMQGQIVTRLPYKVDICAQLMSQEDDAGNWRRGIRLRNSTTHVVGERVTTPDGLTPAGTELPNVIWDVSIAELMPMIFGSTQQEENTQ